MDKLISSKLILLVFLLSNELQSAEKDFGLMSDVHKSLESVVNTCMVYATKATGVYESAMKNLSSNIDKKDRENIANFHITQLELCLEIGAFKLKQAAKAVKKRQSELYTNKHR